MKIFVSQDFVSVTGELHMGKTGLPGSSVQMAVSLTRNIQHDMTDLLLTFARF